MSNYVRREAHVVNSQPLSGGISFEVVHEHVELELKKCPFCGGSGKTTHIDSPEGDDLIKIKCQSCGSGTAGKETHEEAAQAWNRRKKYQGTVKKGLRLCPFCGGKVVFESGDSEDEGNADKVRAKCEECGAESEYYGEMKEVYARWNMRV